MTECDSSQPSRYQRVKEILNAAAEGSQADYQGYGKFWELPLSQLLELEIYGVRMIAPESGEPEPPAPATPPGGSCCHHPPAPKPSGPSKPTPGRGAASGLIKGLRAQRPFDGSQFPRLPWGGKVVADSDIAFIEAWIDDGCPATDDDSRAYSTQHSRQARALGDEAHPLSSAPVNEHRNENNAVIVRKNVNALSPEELDRYRAAIARMHEYDAYPLDERSYDWWARIHANNCQHGWEEFLPWHRLYLYYFEQRLRDIDASVTLPYWDWTDNYQQDWSATTPDSGTIPEAFRCWIDSQAIANLQGRISDADLDKLEAIRGETFNSGNRLLTAAGISYGQNASVEEILVELQRVNPLWHRERWPGGNNSILFEDYPSASDIDNILEITDFFAFGSGPAANHFFGSLENIHNLLHNFSGGVDPTNPSVLGDMTNNGTTAFDPIFWSHHANVDRLWAEWQSRHLGHNPDNPDAVLPPWAQNVGQSFSIAALGYEYLKSTHYFPTDNSVGMQRFRSATTEVPGHVVNKHRKAEVRLHHVRYAPRSGLVRVFLNQPDADGSTPTRGNDRFVGQFHLFQGPCVGGEGHCAEPPDHKRGFDLRPRHRKTASHIRFDASATIRALLAKGETDFTVQAVALDLQGRPADDVLFLRGVSLNFFD